MSRSSFSRFSPKFWASLLLAGMIGLMIVSILPVWQRIFGYPLWLRMLQGGARAGVIGGLADWFAVTALFRHPLGLPIPHTAILPKRKKQLGVALGRFVAGHLFSDDDVIRLLARVNFVQSVATTLRQEQNFSSVTKMMRGILPGMFKHLDDGRGGAFLSRAVSLLLQGEEANVLMVRAMRSLVEGAVHQEVFSFFLGQLKELIIAKEPELRQFVEQRVREQGGRLVGWAIGGAVASQVLGSLKMELERIDPMDSRLRQGFTDWVRGKIDHFEHDPEQIKQITRAVSDFFSHDSLREWGGRLWKRLCEIAKRDRLDDTGWGAQASENILHYILDKMEEQDVWQEKVNYAASQMLLQLMPAIRGEVGNLVARVIEGWDGQELSRKLENGVGRDLAFIRVNGTLVGFLLGAVLETMISLCL